MRLCYHCMTQVNNEKLNVCPECGKSLQADTINNKFLKPGTMLQNKFVVGYPLGAGGFGNTYIGWNTVLLRKVAIKEYYPEQYITRKEDGLTVTVAVEQHQQRFQKGLKQFLEEARSVAALQDIKGVVSISNFFEENGTGYIIMEYLEGMDVKAILKRSGNKKDYEWCRRVILTVLHTLREIHKRGVLHRDIAPDNIFVTKEGVIKLIDFGTAKHASTLANTKAEIVVKKGYAPIEQYGRNVPQGPYTDLYAVAAMFYRMLTGQKPLPANERVQKDSLIPPSEMGIVLPEQAEMAIMICLNVKPEYRLQSADDFMEALEGKTFVPVYEPEWILPPVEEKRGWADISIGAKVLICVVAVLIVLCVTAGGFLLANQSASTSMELGVNKEVIRDYTDKQLAEAESDLLNLGIDYDVVYEMAEDEYGTVIGQNPAAGQMEIPDKFTLFVSGETNCFTMIDFRNKKKDEVINWFSEKDFTIVEQAFPNASKVTIRETTDGKKRGNRWVRLVYDYSDYVQRDVCMNQSVAGGELCNLTNELIIYISCGSLEKQELEIPNFVGKTEKDARDLFEKSGLADYFELKIETSNEGLKAGNDQENANEEVDKLAKDDAKVSKQSIEAGFTYNTLENLIYIYGEKDKTRSRLKVRDNPSGVFVLTMELPDTK